MPKQGSKHRFNGVNEAGMFRGGKFLGYGLHNKSEKRADYGKIEDYCPTCRWYYFYCVNPRNILKSGTGLADAWGIKVAGLFLIRT